MLRKVQVQLTRAGYAEVNDERVVTVERGDGHGADNAKRLILMASKTRPGIWYEVTAEYCPCQGFEATGGDCRHVRALRGERPTTPKLTVIRPKVGVDGESSVAGESKVVGGDIVARMRRGEQLASVWGVWSLNGSAVDAAICAELAVGGIIKSYWKSPYLTKYALTDTGVAQ